MKQVQPKNPRKVEIKKKVKKQASKPKTGLSKSDPDYYSKIGQISASRRKLSKKYFSDMAKKSHKPTAKRDGYHGGRKPAYSKEGYEPPKD